MTLPGWLDAYAALDDDALAVLANRGLARRAAKEAGRLELESADETAVELRYTGTPPAILRLLPGGPRKATCGCPVAGVCVHIVAACIWARTQPPSVELVETPPDDGFAKLNQRDARGIVDELLALKPTAVNRAAGIAAVRKVAAGTAATPTTVEPRGRTLRIAWPGSPEIVAVAGGGFAGLLVAGSHSDVAERAWRLEAVVRLFAANDRAWVWPAGVDSPDIVQPGQHEAMTQAGEVAEALLRGGLSRVGADGVARLTAAAQRARLEALPLLAILLTQARGRADAVARRDDDGSERQLLETLARAWALAAALRAAPAPLPAHLVGGGTGEATEVGTLLPLGLRWWTAPSGARGLTATFWDLTHHRVETVTTGRAAGADPSFNRSWDAPLLWGLSAQTLAGGWLTLTGAERRDDGSLSPTTRTRAVLGDRFAGTPLDLDALAAAVDGAGRGADAIGFLPRRADVRIVLPRRLFGVAEPELDEVDQELRWPITDRAGVAHLARMDATGPDQAVIGALLRDGRQLAAVVLDDRDRPLSVFVAENGRHRLVSPSLTPADPGVRRGWLARRAKQRKPRLHTGPREEQHGPLVQLAEAVLDVCEALASTGRPALSARQADTLRRRADEASGLGLGALAAAIEPLLHSPTTPASVLRATVIAERVGALGAD